MKLEGIKPVKVRDYQLISEDDIRKRTEISEYLRTLGIYNSLYTNKSGLYNLKHSDGIHRYMDDALDAQTLLENDEELPQDLLDRLVYYKPIVDKMLED